MQKTFVLDNQTIKINSADVLGVGGEATVVKVGTLAVKLFNNPTTTRADKLRDFLKIGTLPTTVCAPLKVVYNASGKVIGYAMRQLSPQYEVMQMLASKKYRQKHPSINASVITDILLSGYDTITELHKRGIIIGDNNDLNALFWNSKMMYIDADSFQIGTHPCAVGTENFLDPRLYDIDLAQKPYFCPLDDWYAWHVMFIRSLLMVHPYGGTYKQFGTIQQRAKNRITVLDNGVQYPKVGLHPDHLSRDLRTLFDKMFHQGERFVPHRDIFVNYKDSLHSCSSCGAMYPSERSFCPQCAYVNSQPVQRPVQVVAKPGTGKLTSEILLSTKGQILWKHVSGKTVRIIVNEKGHLFLLTYAPNTQNTRISLMPLAGSPKFDFFSGYLTYNDGTSDVISVLDVSGNQAKEVTHLPVDSYQGERVFACNNEYLLYVSNGNLFRCEFNTKFNKFISTSVTAVSRNQTWIRSAPNGSLMFGCQRFFETLKFFVLHFDPTKIWYVPIEALKTKESILDVDVLFTTSHVLLLLKTEVLGKTFVHVYLIYEDTVKSHVCVESLPSDMYRHIHGKTFIQHANSAIILHPTDDGIIQETLQSGQSKATLLSETLPFLTDSDSIDQYGNGVLIVGDQSVNLLTN